MSACGSSNPHVILAVCRLAYVYDKLDRDKEAERTYKVGLQLSEKHLTGQLGHLEVYYGNLEEFYRKTKRPELGASFKTKADEVRARMSKKQSGLAENGKPE